MRLTALTVHGFKSFVQRTHLTFEPGITALVGPNGSGKSNLVDAVRWVLGEQSLRTLRGRRTEDVLFSGGASRAPAGMAEAGLTLDLEDSNLDLPYRELALVRRAYRSGENEYYLNRDRVRLRDVLDLTARLGLAADSLAVVGQGTVDAALSLRSEDRRALIEHAAAIGHLHLRLADAEDRLRQSQDNLTRVGDLIAEISPRVKSLERQARQARERAALQAELGRGLVRWYAHLWDGPRRRQAQAEANVSDGRARLQESLDLIATSRGEAAALRDRLAEQDRDLAAQGAAATSLATEQTILEQSLALDAERHDDLDRRLRDGLATSDRLTEELDRAEATIGDLHRQRDELARRLACAEAELASSEGALAAWQERRAAVTRQGERARARLAAAEASRARAHARRNASAEHLDRANRALADRECELATVNGEQAAADVRIGAAAEAVASAEQRLAELTRRRQELGEQLEAARRELSRCLDTLGTWERDVQTLRARVDALDALDATGSGYFAGVRTVLQAANGHGTFHLDGIVGMVAKLVVVPAAQELAIETALGSHAQDVVVRRWADAEAAIAELKRRNAGRATFLPLDTLRANRPGEAPEGRGVVGVAAGLVEIDPGLRVVCDFLLGHTLVVDDLATARDVLRRCPGHWQIVTLEGDLARPSGTVTGGSAAASRGTLARFRELREARRALGRREADAHRLREAVVAARAEIARREAERGGEDRAIRAAEDELRRATNQTAEAQRQLAHVQQRRRWLAEEIQRLTVQRDDAGRDADEAAATLTEVERDYAVVATAAQLAQEELAQVEHDAGARLGALLAQRAERDLARQRLVVLNETLEQRHASRRRLAEQLAAERERVIATRAQADATTARRQAAEDRRAILVDEQARRGACLAAQRTEREQTRQALEGASQRLGQLESRESEARESIQTAERQLDRAVVEIDGLRAQVTLELGLPDESALANGCLRVAAEGAMLDAAIEVHPDPEKLRSRLDALRARLRALPPSTDVVTEYEATRARLAFLNGQSVDLQHSAETLRATIDETRATMRARFADTFTVVNAAFSRRFAALFGGGTARLVIDDADEAAGVEVLAQPPGKRTQSLAALSGGERALTAAALLFALIEANPPPFCVLDEVDAALDESNVGRFCGALEELSQRTQFLVVTHNRQTMECAGGIYGLTLEQRSESRVLSLRLPVGRLA